MIQSKYLPLILLTIACTWLGFSNPLYHIPVAVLFLPGALTWIALDSGERFLTWKISWLAVGLAYAASFYWIFVPVHFFGGLPWWVALPCPILIGLFLGLYPSIFSLALYWCKNSLNWFWLGLFAGLTWACLEFLRGILFSGLPWLNLTQAFAAWPWSIQVVNLLGANGTAGIIATLSTWIVLGIYRDKRAWIGAALLLLLVCGYGIYQFNSALPGGSRVKVSLVQGNISQDNKWDPEFQNATVNKYLELSRKEIYQNQPDLLVWPETALPFYIQQKSSLTDKVLGFAKEHNVNILTGAPGFQRINREYELFNRAYLINKQGEIADHYGKEHLVPFGEYVPANEYLPFVNTLVVGSKGFSSGMQTAPLQLNDLDLGILICYEIIFSGLVQKRVANDANILVNISNDAWFGDTSAPQQHLNQAVIRAMEQERYVLRGTNTGFSAFVDPRGNVLNKSNLLSTQTLFSDNIFTVREKTFYSKYYTLLHLFYFIACIGLLIAAKRPGSRG